MGYHTITCDHRGDVAVITLNRPGVMNALNAEMRVELIEAIAASQATARAVVLTGAGRAFCSGQDLADGGNAADLDLEATLRDEYEPLLKAVYSCAVPTIAAVNGTAAGAGTNLALAADVVIAAESARFIQAFARIGLIPDAGGTWWLPRQCGFARAMGACLFGEAVTARQAADWGMIWEAVPDAEFEGHWRGRAEQLAAGPTAAFARLKTALRASYGNNLDDQLRLEARLQGECGRTRDFREGVTAFLEKRPPRFEGA